MRAELLYNPLLLLERLGQWAAEKRRLRRLRTTPARTLAAGHIDSLELLELLRGNPPAVIYDIGANIGTWTLLAKSIFPGAVVHGFEPLPEHGARYLSATESLPEVHLHGIALGEAAASSVLHVTSRSDASSLLPLTADGRAQWQMEAHKEVPVRVERLDDWVTAHALPPPDLIKMDVQGYELHVLKGAPGCLRRAKAVLAEASFGEFYESQCLFEELSSFLAQHHFRLAALGHGTALGRRLVQADVLYLRQ